MLGDTPASSSQSGNSRGKRKDIYEARRLRQQLPRICYGWAFDPPITPEVIRDPSD